MTKKPKNYIYYDEWLVIQKKLIAEQEKEAYDDYVLRGYKLQRILDHSPLPQTRVKEIVKNARKEKAK